MHKILIPTSLLLLSFISAACGSGGATSSTSGDQEAAAAVNGTKITVADVDRVTAAQAGAQKNQLSQLELAAARLQVLDDLIQQEVLYQRAQKDGISPTDQEINEFIQKRKQEGGITEEDFDKQLKESGQTQEQFRTDIRKQMAIQKLQDKLGAQLKVQDREVADFFNSNPQQFVAQRGAAVSDILVDPSDNGMKNDAKSDVAAEQKIKEIYARLKSGTDFSTVARAQSEDTNSFGRSGDLGFIPEDNFGALSQAGLPPGLGARFMNMNEGDITEPIRDARGRWHIFKLTQKRTEKRDLTLDDPEVRKQISDYILNQRKSLLNAALLTRARDEAKIENYLASRTLESPNSFGVLRPVAPAAASASPQASPVASAAPAASPAKK